MIEIVIECHCKTRMKKSSGTGRLTFYCPKCKNKIHIKNIQIYIDELI